MGRHARHGGGRYRPLIVAAVIVVAVLLAVLLLRAIPSAERPNLGSASPTASSASTR